MNSETDQFIDVGEKYKTVLKALLEKDFYIINDVYLNMFISHLSGKNGEDFSSLISDEFTFGWIESSASKIANDQPKSVHGFTFTCQLLALLIENVDHFRKFREKNIYTNIQRGLDESIELQQPSSKLALISLYQSMLKHDDGIEWLKTKTAWKRAITYCIEDETIYLVRRANEFITAFTFKIVNDDTLCLEVITEITRPITDNVFAEQNVCVDSCDLQRKVTPSIDILTNILEHYIQLNEKSSIAHHIIKTTNGKVNLWKLTEMTYDHTFFATLTKGLIYMSYTMLVDTLNKNSIPDMVSAIDCNDFGLTFLNLCKMCILRNQHEALLISARLYYVLWIKLGDRVPEEIILGNQLTKFENQVILFQILPLINVMHRFENCFTELHDDYVMKLFQISTEHTLRVCYSFRNSLHNGNIDIYHMANKAIRGILSMIHVLHRDRAVIVFQALCHVLKGVARMDLKETSSLVERPTFMSSVLTGLYTIVKKYRITWKESTESIGLLNCMLYTIEDPNLSPRLAVEALKLAQLAVEHFLAPNLALLVDTLAGSDMQKLGPMILKRLHDSNWEVRDSVLELLASMANISHQKFPAFQEHILSNGLCPLVFQIAQNDSDYYVRASALNCISQMIPVNLFWEQCFSTLDLTSYLVELIKVEDEGVVRNQAVVLLTCLYENQKVQTNQLDTIYETLSFVAIHDLFWEVKVKAISFWHCVIQRHLQYQGVIDGTFPSVTFSKENKKIVTLTQKEITLRLTKLLANLSACGCLGVLLSSLDDHDDLMVVKKGIDVIKSLTSFLEKYNYSIEMNSNDVKNVVAKMNRSSTSSSSSPVSPSSSSSSSNKTNQTLANSNKMDVEQINCDQNEKCEITENSSKNSDDVIQSIVSAQDINLLSKAYENQMNVDSMDTQQSQIDCKEYFKEFTAITPQIFMDQIKSRNLDEIVKQRTLWLKQTESFSSLLNDMLYSLEAHETQDADCY